MPSENIDQIEALIMLYLNQGEAAEALSLLAKFRSDFEKADAVDSYLFWQVQALIANSQYSEAVDVAKTASGPNRRVLVATALEAVAKHSDEWQPLVEHLEEWYQSTGDGKVLLELCHRLAVREAWDKLATYTEDLMTKVGTPDALRLAVRAYHKSNKIDECLNLLLKYGSIYEDGILPSDLRRLKVACQTELGQLSKAVADAEELVRRDPDVENINLLMETQLAEGDLKGLAIAARMLISHPSSSIKDLLRAARLILPEDSDAASKAWRKAVSQNVEDEDLGLAIDLGFRLGHDNEVGHLIQRAHQLAAEGKGPFKRAELQEFKAWMRSRTENAAFAAEKYDKGEVPIHFFAEKMNLTLTNLLHGITERNRRKPDPLLQSSIFCWHGGRPDQKQLSRNYANWNLCLDITSIILAEDLNLLDLLEECFPIIRISRFLPTALLQQRDALESHQPALLMKYRKLDHLLREGKAQVASHGTPIPSELARFVDVMGENWVLTISEALQKNGFIVEFIPLLSHDGQSHPVELPANVTDKFINCRSVIEALRTSGRISETVYRMSIQQLGSEGTKNVSATLPTLGSDLYLLGNTASLFASDEIIELIGQHFRIFIDSQFVDQIRDNIEEDTNRAKIRQWITNLINKVNDQLERGHFVPIETDSEQLLETTQNYSVRSFYDFFSFKPQSRDVICIDDRFCNGYSNRDGAPIISLLEIIEVFRATDRLSKQRYYELLLQLRTSNLRYLTICSEEVLHHLSQAQIIDRKVVETTELKVLRKYIAACLLDTHRIQKPPLPPGAPNAQGELGFIVSTLREVADSIIGCWERDSPEVAEAKANWILKNLFTGLFGTRHLRVESDPQSDGLDLLGLDIAGSYSRGITLKKAIRESYFNWLTLQLLSSRLHTDPSSITAIADGVSKYVTSMTDHKALPEQYSIVQKAMLTELFLDLPKSLQDELRANPELISKLGIQTNNVIVLNGTTFLADKFWKAAGEALNSRPTEIVGLSPKDNFVVKAGPEKHAVAIINQITGHETTLADPVIRLLYGNATDWEQVLLSNRSWFDSNDEAMKKKIMEIVALTDPQSRIEDVSKIRLSSVALYYQRLEDSIRKTNEFAFDKLLPPSIESLIKHFRFSPNDNGMNFRYSLEKSALQLIEEEGIEEAIFRLSSFPVSLPGVIQASLVRIELGERKALFETLIPRLTSIIQRIQLLSLVLVSPPTSWSLDVAIHAMDTLFGDENVDNDFRLFHSILSWVNDEFSYWADAKLLANPMKLALVWAHSVRLHGIFQRTQAEPFEMAKLFDNSSSTPTAELFDRDLSYWNDVTHPRRINSTILLTHGLSNALHAVSMDTLKKLNIPSRIVALASTETEGFPNPLLLRDSTLCSDALQSFIGGDRWTVLSRYFTDQGRSCITSSQLKTSVEEFLDSILENYLNNSAWINLSAIVGDLPIYEDLRVKTKAVLSKVRVIELGKAKDIDICFALHFLSNQALYLRSDIPQANFIAQLIDFGQLVPKLVIDGDASDGEAMHGSLIEALLTASLIPKDPRQSSKTFYEALTKLLEVHPNVISAAGSLIGKVAFDLPASHLHGAWPLLLFARARRE